MSASSWRRSRALPGGRLTATETMGAAGEKAAPETLFDETPLARRGHMGEPGVHPWIETIRGMIKIATRFVILIIGLIAGPAVSL